jgi:thiamine phosphate synthase YjbQ (UPF0047 family)
MFEGVAVHTGELRLSTRGDADVVDITEGVRRVVASSGAAEGSRVLSSAAPPPR